MPDSREIDLTSDAQEYLDHIPKDDPAGVEIWRLLEAYRRGEKSPRRSEGARMFLEKHRLADGRVLLLGLCFPEPGRIQVAMIRVGRSRR